MLVRPDSNSRPPARQPGAQPTEPPVRGESQHEAGIAMQHCIEDIRQWMLTDRIKLKDDKSEYLLMGTSKQLSKISAGSLVVE